MPIVDGKLTYIPVVRLETVYHVGDLDPLRKNRGSYEADCLSVSLCPDAWRTIARLSGPTYELKKRNGLFIDVLRMSQTARRDLVRWAEHHGYIKRKTMYRAVVTRDDDTGRPGYAWFPNRADARTESLMGESVGAKQPWVATEKLLNLQGVLKTLVDRDAVDLAIMTWAESVGADGVLWREIYAPERLSAPRGGIFARRLGEWTPTLTTKIPENDDAIRALPRPTFVPFTVTVTTTTI
jgi:hypothetical protein